MKKEKPTKEPLLSRVGTWGKNRFRKPELIALSRRNVRSATTAALDAMKPARFDRSEFMKGYHGRYQDGGRARFAQVVSESKLSEAHIRGMDIQHFRIALIFAAASVASIGFGLYTLIVGTGLLSLLSGASLGAVFFLFLALAIRHDFSSWQINARRFGGLSEYLDARFGSNDKGQKQS
ncbi:hypothetical protein AB9K35_04220 [Leisingera sp. XS_AS12]|uniref:hypothetical protein n=1 Tax=Leisingera sp. XS_AS12 TaxID=3241294 RepID=UPI00351312A3